MSGITTDVNERVQIEYDGIRAFFTKEGAELSRDGRGGDCYYRYPDNEELRCAVGCRIPDEIYQEEMEGNSFSAILAEYPSLRNHFGIDVGGIGITDISLLFREKELAINPGHRLGQFIFLAQNEHDVNAENVEHFVELLDKLAIKFGLVSRGPKTLVGATWVKDASMQWEWRGAGAPVHAKKHEHDEILHVYASYSDGTTAEWSSDWDEIMPEWAKDAIDTATAVAS